MAGLRDGVIRRGSSWSYVIRVTDAKGASRPRWVGGFPTEQAAKQARDTARVAAAVVSTLIARKSLSSGI